MECAIERAWMGKSHSLTFIGNDSNVMGVAAGSKSSTTLQPMQVSIGGDNEQHIGALYSGSSAFIMIKALSRRPLFLVSNNGQLTKDS